MNNPIKKAMSPKLTMKSNRYLAADLALPAFSNPSGSTFGTLSFFTFFFLFRLRDFFAFFLSFKLVFFTDVDAKGAEITSKCSQTDVFQYFPGPDVHFEKVYTLKKCTP